MLKRRNRSSAVEADGTRNTWVRIAAVTGGIVVMLATGVFLATHIMRVEPGEVGIQVNYGSSSVRNRPSIKPLSTGYHVQGIWERIVQFPVAQQTMAMVRNTEDGEMRGDDSVACQDRNGVQVNVDSSTLWRINTEEAGELFLLRPGRTEIEQIGNDIVRRDARNAIGIACSRYFYSEIFGEKRTEFTSDARNLLAETIIRSHLVLDDLIIGEIYLQPAQQEAITKVANAQQQAKEAQYLQEKAEYEAEAAIAKANGDKQVSITSAEAEAESIRIVQEQLQESPNYLNYLMITKWNGQLPYVDGEGGNMLFTLPQPDAIEER